MVNRHEVMVLSVLEVGVVLAIVVMVVGLVKVWLGP